MECPYLLLDRFRGPQDGFFGFSTGGYLEGGGTAGKKRKRTKEEREERKEKKKNERKNEREMKQERKQERNLTRRKNKQ